MTHSSNEECAEQPCPLPQVDGASVHDREIAPGVYAIGEVHWNHKTGDWRCLADVNGALCVVQVRLTLEGST